MRNIQENLFKFKKHMFLIVRKSATAFPMFCCNTKESITNIQSVTKVCLQLLNMKVVVVIIIIVKTLTLPIILKCNTIHSL